MTSSSPSVRGSGLSTDGKTATALTKQDIDDHYSPNFENLAAVFTPNIAQIELGLFLGNLVCTLDKIIVEKYNITAALSMMNGSLRVWDGPEFRSLGLQHRFDACSDCGDGTDMLREMAGHCDWIDSQIAKGGAVAVHCAMGLSRSVTVVIGYYMRKHRCTFKEAFTHVELRRPGIRPNAGFCKQLEAWYEMDFEIWEDEHKKVPKSKYKKILDDCEGHREKAAREAREKQAREGKTDEEVEGERRRQQDSEIGYWVQCNDEMTERLSEIEALAPSSELAKSLAETAKSI